MNKERGFVRIIIILIVLGVVLTLLGYNPVVLWEQFVMPILSIVWGIIVLLVDFLVTLLRGAGKYFDSLLSMLGLER